MTLFEPIVYEKTPSFSWGFSFTYIDKPNFVSSPSFRYQAKYVLNA